eukprot:scpid94226/ scgid3880/ 
MHGRTDVQEIPNLVATSQANLFANCNGMIQRAVASWPALFHDGDMTNLDNYVDEMFTRFVHKTSHCQTTPLITLMERGHYMETSRLFHRGDAFNYEFGDNVLAMARMWVANGVDLQKKEARGRTAYKLLYDDVHQSRIHSEERTPQKDNRYFALDLVKPAGVQ